MAKLKLKKKFKLSLLLIVVIAIVIFGGYKYHQEMVWRTTYEYRLLQLDYSEEEIAILLENLTEKQLDEVLEIEYNENLVLLANEKYFIWNNLDRYQAYLAQNKGMELSKVIAMINVNRDRDFYEDPIQADYSKEHLMLVNKYFYLPASYKPDTIFVDLSYAYAGHRLREHVINAFKELHHAAREDGHIIVINSGYRTYEFQSSMWEQRKAAQGTRRADQFAARAGHSEHQTGFAIDVSCFRDGNNDFGKTKAYQWMRENSYKFGFILRYPNGTEDITGFGYEPWHFRYIGIETAEKVFNAGITFDEYYAFYLAK